MTNGMARVAKPSLSLYDRSLIGLWLSRIVGGRGPVRGGEYLRFREDAQQSINVTREAGEGERGGGWGP